MLLGEDGAAGAGAGGAGPLLLAAEGAGLPTLLDEFAAQCRRIADALVQDDAADDAADDGNADAADDADAGR